MGTDKASLVLPSGKIVLEQVIQVVAQTSERVVIVGRKKPANFDFREETIVFLPDETPGEGPAAALKTVLRFTQSPILLIACDMPGVTVEAVEWLWQRAEKTEAIEGVAVKSEGQWEPLFAVYFPDCLPRLETLLAEGKRSLQALLRSGDFETLDPPEYLLPALRNVNTPEEWEAFLQTLA